MVSNIYNTYGCSYASSIGNACRQPLFYLIIQASTELSRPLLPKEILIVKIGKIAIKLFALILFVIPAGVLSLTGKCITLFAKTQIDHKNLHLTPPSIPIPQEEEIDKTIDINQLAEEYKKMMIDEENDHKVKSLFNLCKEIIKNLSNDSIAAGSTIYPDDPSKRKYFCTQMTLYLKGILKKDNELSPDQKKILLSKLADASTVCYPTWFETTKKIYDELFWKNGSVEVKLLNMVQEYKENMILEVSQNVDYEWHALNFVRNVAGKELGLNTSTNEMDPYATDDDFVFGKKLCKWIFLEKYENVNKLITAIYNRIDIEPYDQSYHDFLLKIIESQGIKDPTDYIAEHFFSEDYKLNQAGVNCMLRGIGILK